MVFQTPVMLSDGLCDNNMLYIKREDLLPFSFGGNKVRIAEEFFTDMKRQGKNCMIGYGSTKSNLCRVLANMCYSRGVRCHIISTEDNCGAYVETNNSRLVNASGAIVHHCTKENVAVKVEQVINQCKEEGYSPYYIYGNIYGKGNEAVPVRAYAKVHSEIREQYDYIFLATGTGMTQAGLLAGKHKDHSNEKIIGISVARSKEQEIRIIREYLDAYYKSIGQNVESGDEILVEDKYMGEYGSYTPHILDTIKKVYLTNGIALDTTYTGKAFAGMLDYIRENNIVQKRILFLHTGGTPLFWDNMNQIFHQSVTHDMLDRYIRKMDLELPIPLSQRVDISEYVNKIYEKAHIVARVENGEIVSAVIGYIENLIGNMSYITMVGTLSIARHKGYATEMLRKYILDCKQKKLEGIHLYTDWGNKAAIHLYKSLGFVCANECDRHKDKVHMIYRFGKEN